MEEFETLLQVLERELEVISSLPESQLHFQRRIEIQRIKDALEVMDNYRSQLIEGGLI